MAQTPRIGMFGVRDPGAHAGVDISNVDGAGPPSVAQAAQAVAETPHVVFRQAARPSAWSTMPRNCAGSLHDVMNVLRG